ncbi:MAG: bifunctional riboflavin kinase/FAD synthetase [Candidatus Brocadiales bacterium]
MDVLYGIKPLPRELRWPVVTVGGFDGVHLGHQKIIRETRDWATQRGGEAVVITFESHPKGILSGSPLSFITSLEHRLMFFHRLGADLAVVLDFNEVASMKAEDFISQLIVRHLGTKGWVMGFNFRFGKDRSGDFSLASRLSQRYGFQLRTCPPVKFEGDVISSTRIRKAILAGDLKTAEGMLGRPVSILGTVVQGSGRGKRLGYPTANLDLHHEIKPPDGVYATWVTINGKDYLSITNIGTRPTFEKPGAEAVTEVYVIDFDKDLYGEVLEVKFIYKLREELKFTSVEALKTQMDRDKEEVLSRLAPYQSTSQGRGE